jgi:hypothetical protein
LVSVRPGRSSFQGDAALVQAVGARGQPHLAHPAFAEQGDRGGTARPRCPAVRPGAADQRFGEEVAAFLFQRDQRFQFIGERGVFLAHFAQPFIACFRRQLEQRVDQRGEELPARGVHRVACAPSPVGAAA